MKDFTLDYFKCNSTKLEMHPHIDFETMRQMIDVLTDNHVVYIFGVGDDIFISDDKEMILSVFDMYHNTNSFPDHFEYDTQELYLQEYSSYEEAYKIALSMQETSELCYDDGIQN